MSPPDFHKSGVYVHDRDAINGQINPGNRLDVYTYNHWLWYLRAFASCTPVGCDPPCDLCDDIRNPTRHYMEYEELEDIGGKNSDELDGGGIVNPAGQGHHAWQACYGEVTCFDESSGVTPTPVTPDPCEGVQHLGNEWTHNNKTYRCTEVPVACWQGLGSLSQQGYGDYYIGYVDGSIASPVGACGWPVQVPAFYTIAASANNNWQQEEGDGFYPRCSGMFEFLGGTDKIPATEYRYNRDVSEAETRPRHGTPAPVPDIVERYMPCWGCGDPARTDRCWGATDYTWVDWRDFNPPPPTAVPTAYPTVTQSP